MSATTARQDQSGFSVSEYLTCLNGIVWREALRFLNQRERFVSALVRPLVWLFIFAAGFRQVLGIRIDGDDPALQRHAVVALDGL